MERDESIAMVAMVYGVPGTCAAPGLPKEGSLLMAFPSKSNVSTQKQEREDMRPILGINCDAIMEVFRDTGNHGYVPAQPMEKSPNAV